MASRIRQKESIMNSKVIVSSLFSLLITLIFCESVSAEVPLRINYQGRLTTSTSSFVPDGNYAMSFRIYDTLTGGSLLWLEEQTVGVSEGSFQAVLGEGTTLLGIFDETLFASQSRYLEITVNGETMAPRQQLTSVAYTMQAKEAVHADQAENAQTLGGIAPEELLPAGTTLNCNGSQKVSGIDHSTGNVICSEDIDTYNAKYDTEAEIDAAVANNGYSVGPHTVDTNAETICGDNSYLNGDGSCDKGDSSGDCSSGNVCLGGHTHPDSNASTICPDGYYLNGDGTCDYADSTGACGAGHVCVGGHQHSTNEIYTGTLSTARFDAYNDLEVSGRINNSSGTDILLRQQADLMYLRTNVTRTGYLFIDAITMNSGTSSDPYHATYDTQGYGGIYPTGSSYSWWGYANVDLPHGATIMGVYVYAQDDSYDNGTFSCKLYRRPVSGPRHESIAEIEFTSAVNQENLVWAQTTTIAAGKEIVDEGAYTYFIRGSVAGAPGIADVNLRGCRIRFEYNYAYP